MAQATAHIEGFAGTVITPGDDRYDSARAVFNGSIDMEVKLPDDI